MFLHIDIDSFFVSAHRSVNPEYKGIAVAVGGRSNLEIFNKKRTNIRLINNNSGAFVTPVFYSDREKTFENVFVDKDGERRKIRGIVTTSSYEARAFGVKTAMPLAQALQLCPSLRVIPSDYPLYHRLSFAINEFMKKKIPKIEQYSIDEFFGDVSGWIEDEDVYDFALSLQKEILDQFDIPVSIGIAKAKWIAKLATESAKPYGVFEVKDIDSYINNIPIEEFPGIGRAFQIRLKSYGIQTLGDIKKMKSLFYSWKKPGIQLYHRVTGTDNEGINEKSDRKSVGISRTFDPIKDTLEVKRRVLIMARNITYIVMQLELNPTTYYLKINYEYGIKVKRSWRVDRVFSEQLLKNELSTVYDEIHNTKLGAIKISVSVTNFTSQHPKTLSLLDLESDMKQNTISHFIYELRGKYGVDIIKSAVEI
jgi:DNA polymerase-4